MRTFVTLLALGVFTLIVSASRGDEPAGGILPKDLVGTYMVVAGENGGRPSPTERIEGVLVRFTENSIIVTDTAKKEVYACTYELKSPGNPAKITMTSTLESNRGAKATGLVERDGKTVKLIYKLPDIGEEPTKFETTKGQLMFVLNRTPD